MRFCARFRQIPYAARQQVAINALLMTGFVPSIAGSVATSGRSFSAAVARSGLRKRQCRRACCNDPEQWPAKSSSSIQNHSADCPIVVTLR
jgi:hypothetical protein